jgi:hypothetical protein
MIRLKLKAYQAFCNHFSEEEAAIIIEYIDSMKCIPEDRIGNIFTPTKDLVDSRTELEVEVISFRTEMSDFCSDIKIEIEGLRTEMYKGFNKQLRWMVGTMIATASLAIAIIKLL